MPELSELWSTIIHQLFQYQLFFVSFHCVVVAVSLIFCHLSLFFLGIAAFFHNISLIISLLFCWYCLPLCVSASIFCPSLWLRPCCCDYSASVAFLGGLYSLHSIVAFWFWVYPYSCFCSPFDAELMAPDYARKILSICLGFIENCLGDIPSCFYHWWIRLVRVGIL